MTAVSFLIGAGLAFPQPCAAGDTITVNSFNPACGHNEETSKTVQVTGTGFTAGATVHLTRPGYAGIAAGSVTVSSTTSLSCRFDLTAARPGLWSLVVTNPGSSQAARLGFNVLFHRGSITAWGNDRYGFQDPPAGNDFIAVACGINYGIALRSDGSVAESDAYGQFAPPAGNDFIAVACGGSFALALRSDGSIAGWGADSYGETRPPAGNGYLAISAGKNHGLALRSDGSIAGWGCNDFGQASPPAGSDFVAISAGYWHSIALRSDGTVATWGHPAEAGYYLYGGKDFIAVTAGGAHNTALHADGTAEDWFTPPAGARFVELAAGNGCTIGLGPDGSVTGWGNDQSGSLDTPAGGDFVSVSLKADFGWALAQHPDDTTFAPSITSINPAYAGNDEVAAVSVSGSGFLAGATVSLRKEGCPDLAGTSVQVISGTRAGCSFDLNGAVPGAWDVVVANPDGRSAVLAGGFYVMENAGGSGWTTFYFAEGYTGQGTFDEYLCLMNPGTAAAGAYITYMFADGATQGQYVPVAATSRATVNVNQVVGPDRDVSVMVASDAPIVAERPMYFNYGNEWSGGHVVVGAASPGTAFYFAEGYTGQGTFDEYLCLMNPGGQATRAHVTYMFTDGTTLKQDVDLAATSRATVNVNQAVGPDRDVSVKVTSDAPIVAERPMYFNYRGAWTGGHDVIGAPSPRTSFYFAEGHTANGSFDEYLCLMNPGAEAAEVTVTCIDEHGISEKKLALAATSRTTLRMESYAGWERDVSVMVVSTRPIVAERPMYFNYRGAWTGGHDVIGAPSPRTSFYFAEGYTGQGTFDEYLCLMNPGTAGATAHVTYMFADGTTRDEEVPVGAVSRVTINVNEVVGPDRDVGVTITSSAPIVAERPMYFNYRGAWSGGHDVMGYTP